MLSYNDSIIKSRLTSTGVASEMRSNGVSRRRVGLHSLSFGPSTTTYDS